MNSKEIRDLQDAYQAVYTPQELTEEVQIATEYFYQMGLNGSGIDILVEELGVDEFVEWVYDISDEYTLTEAVRSAKKGSKNAPSYAEVKAALDKKEAAKETSKREKAATKAATKQSETNLTPTETRKGIGARVAGFLAKGIERHNAANKSLNANLSTIGAATAKTANKIGDAASKFKKGFVGEEANLFDYILEYLIAEGYADTNENAIAIMSNMSEEWRGSICEILEIEEGKSDRPLGFMHPFGRGRKQPKGEKTDLKYGQDSEGNITGKYAKMQKSNRES